MKRTDLKAGELYAVRRAGYPCLLLSTAVYGMHRHTWSSQPDEFRETREGTKPSRSASWASGTDYGFITLSGDGDTLANVAADEALAALLAHGNSPKARPEGTSVQFVTSLTAFLAPWDVHAANEAARLDAERARREKERDRRLAAVARHNAVVRRLNDRIGDTHIALAELNGYDEPTGVKLTLAQAERIADLLEGR